MFRFEQQRSFDLKLVIQYQSIINTFCFSFIAQIEAFTFKARVENIPTSE